MTVYVLLTDAKDAEDLSQKSWTVVNTELTNPHQLQVSTASFKQIQEMAHQGHALWLILSAKFVSFYQTKLPKMAEKDILPAIRSIVEDDLPQNFEQYHCFYQVQVEKKQYLYQFGLIDKDFFEQLIYQWQSHGVSISGITVDWMALNAKEMIVLESGDALVHTEGLRAWLPQSLWLTRMQDIIKSCDCFYINEPKPAILHAQALTMLYPKWLVNRLMHRGLFDIRMPIKTLHFLDKISRVQFENYVIKIGLGMVCLSLLSFFGLFIKNSISYFSNQKQIRSYAAYPGVNLEQKLLTYQRQQIQKNQFWTLFIAVQQATLPGIQLLNLNYEALHITVDLSATDMNVLQRFKQNLIRRHLLVKESQVMVTDKGIHASLELKGVL